MTDTPHLGLPTIEAAQAQKHVTHNEALTVLDALVMLAVIDRDLAAPPASPAEGDRYLVKAPGSGGFAGKANQIAHYADGGWSFHPPRAGWTCYVQDESTLLAWNGTAWVPALDVLSGGAVLQNLGLLGVGTTADSTNPFSAKLNNALWTAKTVAEGGDGHLRTKMSKESAGKTLSLLLQDNFSGRAEIGLTGDDDLHVKVSADGTTWLDAIAIDRSTGKLTLGQGFADPAATRAQVAAAPFDALAHNGLQLNGGMAVSQENGAGAVTLTASASVQTKYLLDQWMAVYRGSFVASAQQVTDAPAGYGNSLQVTVATAQASLGANDELSVVQPVEGWRTVRLAFGNAAASPLSLAFWVKAHRTGTYSGAIRNTTVGGSSPRACAFNFTVNAADTWEFKTVSLPGDVTGAWGSGTSAGLYLGICIAGGSSRVAAAGAWGASDASGATSTTNGVAATSDVFKLTGVIILPGLELPSSDRAPLIMRPYTEELALCARYLWVVKSGNIVAFGQSYATYAAFVSLVLASPMRAAPGATLSAVGDFGLTWPNAAAVEAVTALDAVAGGVELPSIQINFQVAGNLVVGNATGLQRRNANARIYINARM